MPTGRLFHIAPGSLQDGPGLRTVVFLKGCALRCPWCHNPEGWYVEPELLFDPGRCIGCGLCQKTCPQHLDKAAPGWRTRCKSCGGCAAICPAKASRLAGELLGAAELAAQLSRDLDFFRGTGGGVTFSGGEPMLQPEFVLACADRCHALGIPVALETSGAWSDRWVGPVAEKIDAVLFDLKHVDLERTGRVLAQDYAGALDNLIALSRRAHDLSVRVTLVPGFNDGEADLRAIAHWLRTVVQAPRVRLQAFHRMAAAKAEQTGRPYLFAEVRSLPADRLAEKLRPFQQEGIEVELV